MKTFLLALACAVAASLQAQLPSPLPKGAEELKAKGYDLSSYNAFDAARLDVLHATTKRFVEEGKHAGIITLIARGVTEV